jgi:opacity protein-like surface antigen
MKRLAAFAVSILIALPFAAFAADGDKVDPDEPTYELGLYLWAASLNTEVDTDQGEFNSRISFSDVWDNLNMAAMGRGRAQFGKFSLVGDVEYMDLESDRQRETLRLGPRGNIEIPVSAKVELDAWIAELSGGYQVLNVKGPFSAGPKDERGTVAELYAGGRYYAIKPVLDAQFGATSVTVGEWEAWVDAIVGARIGIDLSKTVVFGIQGDVGGFNIGNSSDFAWSQITSLGWDFSENMTLYVGYKFLDFKRDVGDNEIKIQIRGPFLATSLRF